MKPKQWLFDNGHITVIKQGRLSGEHKALIENAVRNGAQIEGFAVSTATPKNEAEKSMPKVEKVSVDANRILDVPDEARNENQWEAYRFQDGKPVEVGMRTVDNGCGSSLSYCRCESPRVWVDVDNEAMVRFKPRTRPLPNKRW